MLLHSIPREVSVRFGWVDESGCDVVCRTFSDAPVTEHHNCYRTAWETRLVYYCTCNTCSAEIDTIAHYFSYQEMSLEDQGYVTMQCEICRVQNGTHPERRT